MMAEMTFSTRLRMCSWMLLKICCSSVRSLPLNLVMIPRQPM